MSRLEPVRRGTSGHYTWGAGAEGWYLATSDTLSMISERMPPGATETPHYHEAARQVFYVLSGRLSMVFVEGIQELRAGDALEIPPGLVHQARNDSQRDVDFLVVSVPPAGKDRINAEL